MDCVKLYFKDNLIGILTYDSKSRRYIFVRNIMYKNSYIDEVMGIGDEEVTFSQYLFSFFFSFLSKYSDPNYDNEYNELVRIASMNLDKNQFWLGV